MNKADRATDIRMTRREVFRRTAAGTAGALAAWTMGGNAAAAAAPPPARKIPVIDITDLYHPPQDPGDNMDLIAAYALPEVDLKAVILDVTNRYRRPYVNPADPRYDDPAGGRDPGFIPVWQLNAVFNREIPCATGPFEAMRDPDDPMTDAPPFQQQGVDLLIRTLQASPQPVEVVSFGSARPLAVAWNRAQTVLREKIRRVHLCAGASPAGFLEWNVQLDPHAFVRVLDSDLPVAVYPCATEHSAFDLGPYNTYWLLSNLAMIRDMDPALRRYLVFAFDRANRVDFLAAMEEDPPEEAVARVAQRPHNVWETAVWMQITGRKLVRTAEGRRRILAPSEIAPGDIIMPEALIPCEISVRPDGQFDWREIPGPAQKWIYFRSDPQSQQEALNEALPALYASFRVAAA